MVTCRMKGGFTQRRRHDALHFAVDGELGGKTHGLVRGFASPCVDAARRHVARLVAAASKTWDHAWVRVFSNGNWRSDFNNVDIPFQNQTLRCPA
jgi:hypothetical protein